MRRKCLRFFGDCWTSTLTTPQRSGPQGPCVARTTANRRGTKICISCWGDRNPRDNLEQVHDALGFQTPTSRRCCPGRFEKCHGTARHCRQHGQEVQASSIHFVPMPSRLASHSRGMLARTEE